MPALTPESKFELETRSMRLSHDLAWLLFSVGQGEPPHEVIVLASQCEDMLSTWRRDKFGRAEEAVCHSTHPAKGGAESDASDAAERGSAPRPVLGEEDIARIDKGLAQAVETGNTKAAVMLAVRLANSVEPRGVKPLEVKGMLAVRGMKTGEKTVSNLMSDSDNDASFERTPRKPLEGKDGGHTLYQLSPKGIRETEKFLRMYVPPTLANAENGPHRPSPTTSGSNLNSATS